MTSQKHNETRTLPNPSVCVMRGEKNRGAYSHNNYKSKHNIGSAETWSLLPLLQLGASVGECQEEAGSCGLEEENVLYTLEHTGYRECMDACLHVTECAFITWKEVQETCHLLASCDQPQECLLCVSGARCGHREGVTVTLDTRGVGVSVEIDAQPWFR